MNISILMSNLVFTNDNRHFYADSFLCIPVYILLYCVRYPFTFVKACHLRVPTSKRVGIEESQACPISGDPSLHSGQIRSKDPFDALNYEYIHDLLKRAVQFSREGPRLADRFPIWAPLPKVWIRIIERTCRSLSSCNRLDQ